MLGLTALMSLPKESYPEVQLGMVSIATVYPGGNPREIDQLITQKIEKKIKNMEFGGRASVNLSGIDFSVSALRTWNKLPALCPAQD